MGPRLRRFSARDGLLLAALDWEGPVGSDHERSFGANGERPFEANGGPLSGTNGAAPFGANGGRPYGSNGGRPFGSNGGRPYGSNGGRPYGSNGGRPYGATPLLCLPGIARTALDFTAVAMRHRRTRRVVALDYAGHGESERAADPARYRPEMALRDLLDAMAALHLHRVVVLGTSFGGVLGMALGVLRPGCLAALALNDTGPRLEPVGLQHVRDFIGRDPAFASLDDAAAFLRQALPPLGIPADGWRAVAGSTYARGADGRWHPRWDIRVAKAVLARAAAGDAQPTELWPFWNSLAGVPLLLFWGQESAVLSRTTVRRMTLERPDMPVVTLPGIGHAPTLNEAAAVAGLDRFLEGLP